MATSNQIKALVKSIVDHDESRFYSLVIQVADREEKAGHNKVARDLRELIRARDSNRPSTSDFVKFPTVKRIGRAKQQAVDVDDLLHLTHINARISDLVLSDHCRNQVERALTEFRQKDRLAKFGLLPKRKLLLTGPPGTGKTLTAKVLAAELHLPLYTLQFDGLISRFLGETAAKLRAVFDFISTSRAVYLFDEFDAIGAKRDSGNDVGEIRRVLNSFLQFFEEDSSESLIVCATNHPELLDPALFRRFDDIVEFTRPDALETEKFIRNRLFLFDLEHIDLKSVSKRNYCLSYADLGQACDDAAKSSVLNNNGILTEEKLIEAMRHRSREN